MEEIIKAIQAATTNRKAASVFHKAYWTVSSDDLPKLWDALIDSHPKAEKIVERFNPPIRVIIRNCRDGHHAF